MRQKLQTCALGIAALLLGAAVVMVFASVTTALLILRDSSGPVSAMQISASEVPRPETSPAPRPGVPDDAESASPIANGQGLLTLPSDPKVSSDVERTPAPSSARRTKALETVDARELLRQATTPK